MSANQITDADIRDQVLQSLQDGAGGFDVDGLVDEIVREYGLCSINEIDGVAYWDMVSRYDISGERSA